MKRSDDDTSNPILPNTHTGFGSAARGTFIPAVSGDFSIASGGLAAAASIAFGAAISAAP